MLRNVSSNWVLIAFQIGIVFLLTPFTIRTLGSGEYGAWVLITSITSYLSMLSLGVPMATVQFVAKYASSGKHDELNRTVGSCAGLYLLIGVASAVVGVVLFFVWDRAYEVDAAVRPAARAAFAIVVIHISASFIGQLPYGIMAAHHDFVTRNKIQMSSLVLRTALTYLLLSWSASLVWLAVILFTCFLFEFSVALVVVRRRYAHIRIRLANFDWAVVRQIFGFSLFVLILNIGNQLIFQSDSIIIGAMLSMDDIARFAVAASLAVYLMEFMRGIGAVVMPTATSLQAQDKMAQLREVYLKWSKISMTLTVVACVYLLTLGPRFLGWWIEPDYERSAGLVLQILMLGNLLFLPARAVALPVLMGLGKPKAPTVAFLGAGVANVVLSVLLAAPLGLAGVAWGTTVPNVAFAIVVLVLAGRELGISPLQYVRYVVIKPWVTAIPVFALLILMRDAMEIRSLPGLFAAGVAMLVVFGAAALLFVFRNDPYVDLSARVGAQLRRLKRT